MSGFLKINGINSETYSLQVLRFSLKNVPLTWKNYRTYYVVLSSRYHVIIPFYYNRKQLETVIDIIPLKLYLPDGDRKSFIFVHSADSMPMPLMLSRHSNAWHKYPPLIIYKIHCYGPACFQIITLRLKFVEMSERNSYVN